MYAFKKPVFICAARRTAIGSFQGALASQSAPLLGAAVVRAIMSELKLGADTIQDVIVGSVLTAGVGQAPGRQVAIFSGLSNTVQAMTINKVCSSGLKAVQLAANLVELGQSEAVLAGGIENMSQTPYYLGALRGGARLGDTKAEDGIIKDALWDVYNQQHMGSCAELCAREHKITREMQDAFALQSYEKANRAIKEGAFTNEIIPVTFKAGKAETTVSIDEEPGRGNPAKVPELRPAFDKAGTVTAANASKINDGAAMMLVCSEAFVKKHGLTPEAMILGAGWNAHAPEWFTTAPVGAIENLLKATNRNVSSIDLFEVNEAFSAVALAIQSMAKLPAEKVNINGGAVALGHPVGASGARILTTLVHTLRNRKLKRGVAAICNGGGEATSLLVEAV